MTRLPVWAIIALACVLVLPTFSLTEQTIAPATTESAEYVTWDNIPVEGEAVMEFSAEMYADEYISHQLEDFMSHVTVDVSLTQTLLTYMNNYQAMAAEAGDMPTISDIISEMQASFGNHVSAMLVMTDDKLECVQLQFRDNNVEILIYTQCLHSGSCEGTTDDDANHAISSIVINARGAEGPLKATINIAG